MAKQKKATNLSMGIGHDGKLSAALPTGYATFLADVKASARRVSGSDSANQFYTLSSIVPLLTEVIEPYHGRN